jgi:hypothetical protein
MDRSARREVRNPILGLPAAQAILAELSPDQRKRFRDLFRQLKVQCRAKEADAYRYRKGPMTAYWMAAGTYSGHLAHVLNGRDS